MSEAEFLSTLGIAADRSRIWPDLGLREHHAYLHANSLIQTSPPAGRSPADRATGHDQPCRFTRLIS
jgi:hypothetical protein